MLPSTFRCPSCKCHALYRTRRRGLGWLLSLIAFWPARCFTCGKRCYVYLQRRPLEGRTKNKRQEDVTDTPVPKRLKLTLD